MLKNNLFKSNITGMQKCSSLLYRCTGYETLVNEHCMCIYSCASLYCKAVVVIILEICIFGGFLSFSRLMLGWYPEIAHPQTLF
jgi:hypothetical protein